MGRFHDASQLDLRRTILRNSQRCIAAPRSLPSLAKAVIVSCEVFREIDNIGRITYMCYQTQEVCFSLQRREFEMESFMVGKLTVLVHSSFIYGKKQTGKLRKHIFCGNACLSYPNTRYNYTVECRRRTCGRAGSLIKSAGY